jgi:hypothetical protein
MELPFFSVLAVYLAVGIVLAYWDREGWQTELESWVIICGWPIYYMMLFGVRGALWFAEEELLFEPWRRTRFFEEDTEEFYICEVYNKRGEFIDQMFIGVPYTEQHPIIWFFYRRFPKLAWRSSEGKRL